MEQRAKTFQPREKKQSIKRPMNAFMIWGRRERKELKRQSPELDNCSISRILGTRWRSLEEEEKKKYYELQEEEAREHRIKFPEYKYTPRRRVKRKN